MSKFIKTALFIIAILLISCSSRVIIKYKNHKTNENMEKLNIDKLYNLKKTETETIKFWNNTPDDKNIEYFSRDKINNIVTSISGSSKEGYTKRKKYIDLYLGKKCVIVELSIFNSSGKLIKKGMYCNIFIHSQDLIDVSIDDLEKEVSFYTEIGIWTEYDRDGTVIKKTDFDKDFDFSLVDVIEYLKSINVDFTQNNISRKVRIEKNVIENCWIINHPINEGKNNTVRKILNGKTGEIISEKKSTIYNG